MDTPGKTLTLAEFLEARIADREAVARDVIAERHRIKWSPGCEPGDDDFSVWNDTDASTPHVAVGAELMLADCAALRHVIDLAYEHAATLDGEFSCCHEAGVIRTGIIPPDWPGEEPEPLPESCAGPDEAERFLKPFIAGYVDHEDFREEWRLVYADPS